MKNGLKPNVVFTTGQSILGDETSKFIETKPRDLRTSIMA